MEEDLQKAEQKADQTEKNWQDGRQDTWQSGQQDGRSPAVVRNYRDTVFRMLFRERRELLSLFNAVNSTAYNNPDDLQVNTLENAVYMTMKNDISCVLDMQMNLFEHQSTVNPNIPLRDLHYVSKLYEVITQKQSLYSRKRILLPAPRFIVLYNGSEEQPERREMRLSDSYAVDTGEASLELVVLQLNINPGYNETLVKSCKTLWEYVQYTGRVRRYNKQMPLRKAVERAVDECIKEGILVDFLRKNRAEVVNVSIFEYDEEFHMGIIRAEEREEGKKEERKSAALRMIKRGKLTLEEIAEDASLPLEDIKKLAEMGNY